MNELDYLIGQFQDRIQQLGEAITYGHCSNHEEYKYACGQVRGLEAACSIIKDLKDRKETQDDE